MPNRTIEQALREHTGCTHEPFCVAGERATASVATAADGSSYFHWLSNIIMGIPGHTRHPMDISDEEYASFLRASEEPVNAE